MPTNRQAATPSGSRLLTLPGALCQGATSKTMPANPSSTPSQVSAARVMSSGAQLSINTIHSGVVAMNSEAMPEGMCCFCPHQRAVAAAAAETAHHRRRQPLLPARRGVALGAPPDVQDRPEIRKRTPAEKNADALHHEADRRGRWSPTRRTRQLKLFELLLS